MTINHLTRIWGAGSIILLLASLGWAAPSSAGVINDCVKKNGDTRIITPPDTCKKDENPVSWNDQGVAGPMGPADPLIGKMLL